MHKTLLMTDLFQIILYLKPLVKLFNEKKNTEHFKVKVSSPVTFDLNDYYEKLIEKYKNEHKDITSKINLIGEEFQNISLRHTNATSSLPS